MPQPIRLAINGASGRMGRALLALVREDRRFELVHALVSAGSEHNGTPVFGGVSAGLRYSHSWEAAPAIDVVIDFSGPEGLAAAVAHCTAHGIALVVGTTGIVKVGKPQKNLLGKPLACNILYKKEKAWGKNPC